MGRRCVVCVRTYFVDVDAAYQAAELVERRTNKSVTKQLGRALARSGLPTLLDHFVGFQVVPELVAHLKNIDPNGVYEWTFDVDGGVKRFRSLTVICSWWIACGQHLRHVLSMDGSGLRSIIGGTLISSVALTANNNVVPLGLLITSTESGETVTPFLQHLRRVYPTQKFIISDSGRAFEAGADNANFVCHGGCSWHVRVKNARAQVWSGRCCCPCSNECVDSSPGRRKRCSTCCRCSRTQALSNHTRAS